MNQKLKLNLGCGSNQKPGYLNVDKYGNPEMLVDLEKFPWPWEDSSVSEILLNHVLEHLGETSEIYLKIIQELYRVCSNKAILKIRVPHPRHDDFITDPTHVRIITPDGIRLFSQKYNQKCIKEGFANSPLGLYLNVDLEIISFNYILDPFWQQKLVKKEFTEAQIMNFAFIYLNVIKEIKMEVEVLKNANI
jgi:hypothetical protein